MVFIGSIIFWKLICVDIRYSLNHQGDSGGPLTYRSGDQHVLIGVVSFGDLRCGRVSQLSIDVAALEIENTFEIF